MPISHAARMVAISREAKAQSEVAIRSSLRLLRERTYPDDRSSSRPDTADGGIRVPSER